MKNVENETAMTVKGLRISFKTNAGKVQAVRDIDFRLNKGETLAIVGESGSGKSVTARSILGILAPNAVVEGGEIIFDGQDLLKISEDDFYKIRGEKISMIFQDPLSSLNPIVKVGTQLTEAMIFKGRDKRRACRKEFNERLASIRECLDVISDAKKHPEIEKKNQELIEKFDRLEIKHVEMESDYKQAHEAAISAIDEIDDLLFKFEKSLVKNLSKDCKEIIKYGIKAIHQFVIGKAESVYFTELVQALNRLLSVKEKDNRAIINNITEQRDILSKAVKADVPDFFAIAGFLYSGEEKALPDMPINELIKYMEYEKNEDFIADFTASVKEAVRYSFHASIERKKELIKSFELAIDFFSSKDLDKKKSQEYKKLLVKDVYSTIDKLSTVKDNPTYTFESALTAVLNLYFAGKIENVKEERRYSRDMEKWNRVTQSNRTPDWKIVPAALIDLEHAQQEILKTIRRLRDSYIIDIEKASDNMDFGEATCRLVNLLKEKASGYATVITKRIAKIRAFKLMEEVGISEPRKRYSQYPFEFSGGMRQRIVIAIALAANPDILICDEPTTALDVTIQAQILELINKLKKERNISVLFITHDLGVVANMADRIAVMYAGKIVEYGTAEDIFYSPAHPYTWALLSSMPDLATSEKLEAIQGTPPNMIYPPAGDAFAARSKYAMEIDFELEPPVFQISDTHFAATWLLHEYAPKVSPPAIVTNRIKKMKEMVISGAAEYNSAILEEGAQVNDNGTK